MFLSQAFVLEVNHSFIYILIIYKLFTSVKFILIGNPNEASSYPTSSYTHILDGYECSGGAIGMGAPKLLFSTKRISIF